MYCIILYYIILYYIHTCVIAMGKAGAVWDEQTYIYASSLWERAPHRVSFGTHGSCVYIQAIHC